MRLDSSRHDQAETPRDALLYDKRIVISLTSIVVLKSVNSPILRQTASDRASFSRLLIEESRIKTVRSARSQGPCYTCGEAACPYTTRCRSKVRRVFQLKRAPARHRDGIASVFGTPLKPPMVPDAIAGISALPAESGVTRTKF